MQRAGLMRITFFCGEPAPPSGLEYVPQCFYSSMRFSQRARHYGDIPETHQMKAERFRFCGQSLI